MKIDEIEGFFYTFENCISILNYKGIKICLLLLNSNLIPPCLFINFPENYFNLLEKLANSFYFEDENNEDFQNQNVFLYKIYQDCKKLALNVLNKLIKIKNFKCRNIDQEIVHFKLSIFKYCLNITIKLLLITNFLKKNY